MCLKLSDVTYTVHLCGFDFCFMMGYPRIPASIWACYLAGIRSGLQGKENNEHCEFFWVCVFLENFIRAWWFHARQITLEWWLNLNNPHVNKKFSLKQPPHFCVWLWLPPSTGDSVLLWWDLVVNHTKDNTEGRRGSNKIQLKYVRGESIP